MRSRRGSTEDWVALGGDQLPAAYHFAEVRAIFVPGAGLKAFLSTTHFAPISDEVFEDAWAQLSVEEEALG